jgi:hypothetical protein
MAEEEAHVQLLTLPLDKILSGVANLTQYDAPEDGRAVAERFEYITQVNSWPPSRSYCKRLAQIWGHVVVPVSKCRINTACSKTT